MIGVNWRFWLPLAALALFAVYSSQKLIRAHVDPDVDSENNYVFTRPLKARRGAIRDVRGEALAMSVPVWDYHLDAVALTNRVVRRRGCPPRPREAIVLSVARALGLDYRRVLALADNVRNRYQPLAISSDPDAHALLADSTMVSGVVIENRQIRQYPQGRLLSHVIGSINAEEDGSAGIELKYDGTLKGLPGEIRGMKDALGAELYDKRMTAVDPVPGADVRLTVDRTVQFETEKALADGIAEFGAGSGWALVMDAETAAVLSMASRPDFHPLNFGSTAPNATLNRNVAYTYEPGSVMKVVTAAAAIDSGRASPGTLYATNRDDKRYYALPGDGSHKWEPLMSVKDAIVHSSNIVIGKLGVDLGPAKLWEYMRAFGFGAKTGIELPGEETGILRNWKNWDKKTWSRAPIGQGVAVTAIQLASAYQAIANDGVRMRPHIIAEIVDGRGKSVYRHEDEILSRPVKPATARTMRSVMLGVASKEGTARRARIPGYSVAGKTGTAQKVVGRAYAPGLYRATFCGIVPASAPRLVILVTLDFDARTLYHQGGNSAGVVFRRLGKAVLRYLEIAPDRPEELEELNEDDEVERLMDQRARRLPAP